MQCCQTDWQTAWQHKQKLISELNQTLTQNIILGKDPQKAIDEIARKMNVSKSVAGRLVMTEEAYFNSAAQKDCLKELDVEEYEIVATLDSHTSEICQAMDGKHFKMSEWEVGATAPPFHVYCRSTTVPYFGDEFDSVGERAARDEETGKTYYVPENMTYKDWKKAMVDGDKSGLKEVKTKQTAEQKKEQIQENEKKITSLYKQKEEAEFKVLTSSDVAEMQSASEQVKDIENTITLLKQENVEMQKSLGLPTNSKDRFFAQKIDVSTLPQDVQGDAELEAISAWTRTDYVPINRYLRNSDKGVRAESIHNAEVLENMIERNTVQEAFTVKRGTDFNALNHLFGSDSWKNPDYNVSGKKITDKGFMATTPDTHGGFASGIQMYIDVPEGTKGIYLGDLSAAPDEKEFLLQRGTSFIVEKITRYGEGESMRYNVYMKVVVNNE